MTRSHEEDRALLRDIEKFNKRYAEEGWHVSDFSLDREDLSNIHLENSSVRESAWNQVVIRDGVIENTVFEDVEFQGLELKNTRLVNVRFINCTFLFPRFSEVRMVDVIIEDAVMEEGKIEATLFEKSRFRRLNDHLSVFVASSFVKTTFAKGTLSNTGFHDVLLEETTFQDIQLTDVSFRKAEVQNALFQGATLDATVFAEGYGTDVTFERCRGQKGLSIVAPQWSTMTMSGHDELQQVRINDAELDTLSLTELRNVTDFIMRRSKVGHVHISGSELNDFGMQKTEVAGGQIEASTFWGLGLAGSHLSHVDIAESTIGTYLILDGAVFDQLSLTDISYQQVELVTAADVRYINADTFTVR